MRVMARVMRQEMVAWQAPSHPARHTPPRERPLAAGGRTARQRGKDTSPAESVLVMGAAPEAARRPSNRPEVGVIHKGEAVRYGGWRPVNMCALVATVSCASSQNVMAPSTQQTPVAGSRASVAQASFQ